MTYTCDGKQYTGFVALPKTTGGAKAVPGVLVGHTWTGLGKMEMFRSTQLAEAGYVAFALDVYGTGIRPQTEVWTDRVRRVSDGSSKAASNCPPRRPA